jgi:hypothetical protein
MGMDLHGPGGRFHFSIFGWAKAMQLGVLYGWEPMGTQASCRSRESDSQGGEFEEDSEDAWGGCYDTNDFQTVVEEDARNWADALERAMDDIPRERAWEGPAGGIMKKPDGSMERLPEPNVFQWFSGAEGRDHLQKFIAFCRTGAFSIG